MKNILLLSLILSSSYCWDNLVTSNPSPEAIYLYQRIQNSYGTHIISGNTEDQSEQIKNAVGVYPMIRGYDMQNYSPHNPWHLDWSPWDDGNVERAIVFYRNTNGNGMVEFHWHWFCPMYGYQQKSTFYIENIGAWDVSKAVQSDTVEYRATIDAIDAIAVQLKRLRDANVPVLWRPLHEAAGNQWNTPWFWWGSKGATVYKQLWNIMFDRLNNFHQLNNLIWVYSINWDNENNDWYPGKSMVDIVGIDNYPGNFNYQCENSAYENLHSLTGGSKIIGLTETGPIPDIDNCFNQGIKWNFWIGWSTLTQAQNDQNHLISSFINEKTYHL